MDIDDLIRRTGDLNSAVESNPAAASAAGLSLLRGILAILGQPGDAAGANTVIGQLKQIAANTDA